LDNRHLQMMLTEATRLPRRHISNHRLVWSFHVHLLDPLTQLRCGTVKCSFARDATRPLCGSQHASNLNRAPGPIPERSSWNGSKESAGRTRGQGVKHLLFDELKQFLSPVRMCITDYYSTYRRTYRPCLYSLYSYNLLHMHTCAESHAKPYKTTYSSMQTHRLERSE
jgi:hypothetical protein